MKTKVDEVRIIPINPIKSPHHNDVLVALATCIIDSKFFVGSIGVYQRDDGGYRITYPTKRRERSELKLFCPLNVETGQDIEDAIVGEYLKLYVEE